MDAVVVVEEDAPKVYTVMAVDPAEQGHANVLAGVFFDKDVAWEAADKWSRESEDRERARYGDNWRRSAISFYAEEVKVITSVADIPDGDTVYP